MQHKYFDSLEKPRFDGYVNNLLKCYYASVASDNDGFFYHTAQIELSAIASDFGLSLHDVCWITATLSPSLSWELNKRSVIALLSSWFGKQTDCRQSAYGQNVAKCELYLSNRHNSAPTGRKVSAFYKNLMGDYSVVTIDRHAIRAARWGLATFDRKSGEQQICDREFAIVQNAYIHVAKILGLRASYVQACVWQLFCEK